MTIFILEWARDLGYKSRPNPAPLPTNYFVIPNAMRNLNKVNLSELIFHDKTANLIDKIRNYHVGRNSFGKLCLVN